MNEALLKIKNCESVLLDKVPVLNISGFRETIINKVKNDNCQISALFGIPEKEKYRLISVISNSSDGDIYILSSYPGNTYDSITAECPKVHLFEREIFENYGIYPKGHPWLKFVRNKKETNNSKDSYFRVEGEQIHEVAVGPVHAGIIEPGHFRFQCAGEKVLHLEISLGYQHRGIEKFLISGPDKRTNSLIETIAGDTTIGHGTAYCGVFESLSETNIPKRAEYIRAIALELERLANHTGDLGALANDVGFLPTASYCGRLRGDFLNMIALLCGNRFGRNLVIPGGVKYEPDKNELKELKERLVKTYTEVKQSVDLLWETPSVMNRFTDTGKLEKQDCIDLGIVGPAARSCGIETDIRRNFSRGIYRDFQIPVATSQEGDVFARAYVRWLEIRNSVKLIDSYIDSLPDGKIMEQFKSLKPEHISVSLTEGWRGEICHVAITDELGKFANYKIVDSSFHNWTGLAVAMRNQQISDFPLCNKSFNLSYCGFDL